MFSSSAFCTNVAETSLTVPNVQIVINSGLAKEARFDVKRRMNVVEEVFISVASADQRKGRAGRTNSGHCVRLFRTADLPRENIEPEILRSSLDMVVLQLVKLGYNPLEFPFMDQPAMEILIACVSLLNELGCLAEDAGTKLTPRGQLFNDMPFDPRMSNFVVSAFENGVEFLEPAAEVASILTAPESIFFMGGADKAAKLARQSSISVAAAQHNSDLLFFRSIYREWFESGLVDSDGLCKTCGMKPSKRDRACNKCRKTLANEMTLNNKVISIVQVTVEQVLSIVKKTKLSFDHDTPKPIARKQSTGTLETVLGRCLAKCFFDQICQLVLPSKPDAGVYLLEADEKGSIAATSTVSQRVGDSNDRSNSFYIAMSINQLPSGDFKVERLHRVLLEWLPLNRQDEIDRKAFVVVPCYIKVHISSAFQRKLDTHFLRWSKRYRSRLEEGTIIPRGPMPKLEDIRNVPTEIFADFTVCSYDQIDNTLYVYGPKREFNLISSLAEAYIDDQERKLLDY